MASKRTVLMACRTVFSPIGDQFLSPPEVWPAAKSSETTDEIRSHSVVVITAHLLPSWPMHYFPFSAAPQYIGEAPTMRLVRRISVNKHLRAYDVRMIHQEQ